MTKVCIKPAFRRYLLQRCCPGFDFWRVAAGYHPLDRIPSIWSWCPDSRLSTYRNYPIPQERHNSYPFTQFRRLSVCNWTFIKVYCNFSFKSYAPLAFRYFRDIFDISVQDYLNSIGDKPLMPIGNPGTFLYVKSVTITVFRRFRVMFLDNTRRWVHHKNSFKDRGKVPSKASPRLLSQSRSEPTYSTTKVLR